MSIEIRVKSFWQKISVTIVARGLRAPPTMAGVI